MANEATIFDSFSRYNDALLGIQEARFRREDEAAERQRMEVIANRVRQENSAEASKARQEDRGAREAAMNLQAVINSAARAEAERADQAKLAEARGVHTNNARILQKQISDIDKELAALQEIPISVRNQNARLVAQTVVKDKDTLDRLFNPNSLTDNSLNFGKIPGKEEQALFLAQELARRNDATLAPRAARMRSLIDDRKQLFDVLGETMRYAALSEPAVAYGPAEAPPPLAVSDPQAAAAAFLPGSGKTTPAAPTNPGFGLLPNALNFWKQGAIGLGGPVVDALGYSARRAGAEIFGTQRPEVPASWAQSNARAAEMWKQPAVATPSAVGPIFNAPGAPQSVPQDGAAFQADGLQKLQSILEQRWGPDSFIPEEAFPAIINMAKASGWSDDQIQKAADAIHSGNVLDDSYGAALGFYRQYKAMSQGIPAPIQPGQSPGMQFGPAQIQFGPPEIQFGPR